MRREGCPGEGGAGGQDTLPGGGGGLDVCGVPGGAHHKTQQQSTGSHPGRPAGDLRQEERAGVGCRGRRRARPGAASGPAEGVPGGAEKEQRAREGQGSGQEEEQGAHTRGVGGRVAGWEPGGRCRAEAVAGRGQPGFGRPREWADQERGGGEWRERPPGGVARAGACGRCCGAGL